MSSDQITQRYLRFARDEAPGRSELYRAWALAVAEHQGIIEFLSGFSEMKRQPALVFAVSRYLGSGVVAADEWVRWVMSNRAELADELPQRNVQINEPQRCALIEPMLAEIGGEIALIELGAAAGFTLYPDAYTYSVAGDTGQREVGGGAHSLTVTEKGTAPARNAYRLRSRMGSDLHPLDMTSDDDRRWMECLVWPGEIERSRRISDAMEIATQGQHTLVRADGADHLGAFIETFPQGASIVVSTVGLLPYLPRADRERLVRDLLAMDVDWISVDKAGSLEMIPVTAADEGQFVLTMNGERRAHVDPLGHWVEWLPKTDSSRA